MREDGPLELHLKYRPKDWDHVLGHRAAVKSIRTVLEEGRARTFILTGPSGVGKTTIARLIAKEVGCAEADLLEVDGATSTGIDAMREVTSRLQYKSLTGGARVIIVDECQAISKQSFQSLLKSIEEPPEGVYWILCTTEPDRVPKTIKTRCPTYDLKPVKEETLLELLKKVRAKEKLPIPEEGLESIAKAAEGSPRQALVTLGACGHLEDVGEIDAFLETVGESKEAIDLCRLLFAAVSGKPTSWKDVSALLRGLETPPESTRIIVLRYMTTIALSGDQRKAGPALDVMDAFSTPFLDREGVAPLVRACATVWADATKS